MGRGVPNGRQLLKDRHTCSAPLCAGPDRRWDAPIRRGGSRSTALKHPRSWRATICRASMPTPVTTDRYHLPVGSIQEPLSDRVACRAGRDATHHGGRAPGRVKRWHGTCTRSVQRQESRGKALHAISSTHRKETTIMAALTLEEWRDRTLEQVHFAAEAALNAVVVQGHPSIRQYVAAMATGDLHQCLAQGPNIDFIRRMAQGMAMRCTAVPAFATTPDPKGALSL